MKQNRVLRWLRIAAAIFVFLLCIAVFTGFGGMAAAKLMHLQFAPALMSGLAGAAVSAVAISVGILLSAWIFGRFYCAICCPFGILQDLFIWISRRKKVSVSNFKKTRLVLTAVIVSMAAAGANTGFLLLDPYSNFGRMWGAFLAGGFISLVLIAVLAVWKKRIFCTVLCPAGTLLGWAAKYGIFRLQISEKCVKCGKCARVCPASCVDFSTGNIDNERCVRCLECLAACPVEAIHFTRERKIFSAPTDVSRRKFIINGSILLGGAVAGVALAKGAAVKFARTAMEKLRILPPGAGNAADFAARCTSCQLCAVNCPSGIIVPAADKKGVKLDYSLGNCKYNCNTCSQLCPTGAIKPLSLELKRRTKIAEASFDPTKCIVFQEGEKCGRCAGVCPVGAITLRANTSPRPVNTSLCIGCGACQYVCPAPGKAMTVHALEKQITLQEK